MKKTPSRTNDPEATKANIIEVATQEFADHGLSGARVDAIAERTRTSKRMIYYYFGSKEGLYREVLVNHYKTLRGAEKALQLDGLGPLEALAQLVRSTVDFHNQHVDGVRLIIGENIQHGRNIEALPSLDPINSVLIGMVREICERGARESVMRQGLDPVDLYMSIAALAFFNVSNRHTFSMIFHHDMESPAAQAKRRDVIVETILRYVAA